MGFWHVPPEAGGVVPALHAWGVLSEAEGRHAWIAYQRPPGNLDIARDPSSGASLVVGRGARRIEVID